MPVHRILVVLILRDHPHIVAAVAVVFEDLCCDDLLTFPRCSPRCAAAEGTVQLLQIDSGWLTTAAAEEDVNAPISIDIARGERNLIAPRRIRFEQRVRH